MFKQLLLLLIVSPICAETILINPKCVSHRGRDNMHLIFEDKQFYVANVTRDTFKAVDMAFSDKMVRKFRTQDELDCFFKHDGKLVIKESTKGDYSLQAHMPLKGGGFYTAGAFWLTTQVAGYTCLFTSIIGINAVLPGVGTAASVIAVGGSYTAAIAAINAASVKAFCFGALLPLP